MAPRRGEKRKNWLLIKGKDEEARDASDPDILLEEPQSVVSGRTIEEVGEGEGVRDSSPDSEAGTAATAALRRLRRS